MKIAAIIALFTCTTLQVMACSKAGPSCSIEYLYWKVQEDQLYPVLYAVQGSLNGLNTNDLRLKNQKFDYNSGFRATVGYDLGYENYDTKLAWTYMRTRTTSFFPSTSKSLIVFSFFDQTNSDTAHAGSVSSRWHLDFNMIDFEMGHKFKMGRYSIRPTIGLKGGWIHQTQDIAAQNVILGQGSPVPVATVPGTANRKNDFNGIGPRVGVDMRYGLGSQFGLFGNFSTALLYGKFDLNTKTFLTNTLDNNNNLMGPLRVTIKNPECYLSPTVQFLLGGDWTSCLCQKYWVRFGVAYEVQYWWNQMRATNSIPQALFINSPAGGDLMMHGLTVQASFEF